MEERGKIDFNESEENNIETTLWEPIDPVNNSFEKIEYSLNLFFKLYNSIFKKKKNKKLSEEEIKQHYNVYIYQVLPHPPDNKENIFKNSKII